MGALDNAVAVEIAEGIAGPFCGQLLAEAGARVIKIEPLTGDCARLWGPPFVGRDAAVFASLNRGKESLAVDLSRPEGLATLRRLVDLADLVVEDRASDDLGLEALAEQAIPPRRPDLVWCSLRDFSEEGPLRGLPACELVYQGLADCLNSLGKPGEPPCRIGADAAGMAAGLVAYLGLLGAVFHRERTGEGQRVRIDKPGALLLMRTILWTALSDPDDWFGVHCDHYVYPPEHGTRTKDGAIYFMLRRGSEELFDRLIIRLGIEWVTADPRFADGGRQAMGLGRYAHEVKHIWEEAFKDLSTEEVVQIIREHGGEAVPFMDYPSLLRHPQVEALGTLEEAQYPGFGAFRAVGAPWSLSDQPRRTLGQAPGLGEHTRSVLEWLGWADKEIRHLAARGVLALGTRQRE